MERMTKTYFLIILLVAPLLSFAGGSIDLAVGQNAVRLEHDATRVDSGAHFSFGRLYNKEQEYYLLSTSFNMVDQTAVNHELIGGVGLKGFAYKTEESAVSLGLGGFVRYQPTMLKGLGMELMYYYAPNILTFNETENFHEFLARINYRVHAQARIFIGWTDVGATFIDQGYQSIDQSANFGIRLNY